MRPFVKYTTISIIQNIPKVQEFSYKKFKYRYKNSHPWKVWCFFPRKSKSLSFDNLSLIKYLKSLSNLFKIFRSAILLKRLSHRFQRLNRDYSCHKQTNQGTSREGRGLSPLANYLLSFT